jgi:DnaJ-class molecular chaperone
MCVINVVGLGISYDVINVCDTCRGSMYMIHMCDQCRGSRYMV